MTFLTNFLIVLSKIIGWKVLEKSYNSLLGLEIIIDIETLKRDSQWPNSIHVLAILISFQRYLTSLTHLLRCLHNSLSGPEVNELLHFAIVLINFSSENRLYFITCWLGISPSKSEFIWQFCTILNSRWRACHKLLSLIYGWLLYWIALIARSLYFLTQFMSSHSLQFLLAISWIFRSKELCFVFLTVLLNHFQSLIHLDCLYFSRSLW